MNQLSFLDTEKDTTTLTISSQLMIDAWSTHLHLTKSCDTVSSFEYGFRQFRRRLDVPLLQISPEMVEDWLIETAEDRSRSTLSIWFYAVKSFTNGVFGQRGS